MPYEDLVEKLKRVAAYHEVEHSKIMHGTHKRPKFDKAELHKDRSEAVYEAIEILEGIIS